MRCEKLCMIDIDSYKCILIVGYGISGKSVYNFLKSKNLNLKVFDDLNKNIPDKFDSNNWGKIDLVIKNPSIHSMAHNCHPIIKKANDKNIPVISTFDVFRVYNPNAKLIAITGTNGKSTTTALIYHILKHSGFSVQMGGNIGVPYFELQKSEWYVLEMSSYELASSKYLDFEIAGVINIEPDHLDFHGSFENYIESKHAALENAKCKIISLEDEYTTKKYANKENVITISTKQNKDADIQILENTLFDSESQKLVIDLSGLDNLKGLHNFQNIEFAYAVCKKLGLSSAEILKNIRSFQPLPHRLNIIRKIKHVLFVNDSKATNPGSAARALATFIGYKIYWLVGGRSKKTDPMPYIKDYLSEVQKIYLFGESMDEFEGTFKGQKKLVKCKTMESALNLAYRDAIEERGPSVVLLSPMCASFDQFKSFEERGEIFSKLVKGLK